MGKNLIITACLILGVFCWGIAAFLSIRYRKNGKAVIRAVGVGVFASLFFFVYPYAMVESGLFAVPFALLQVMGAAVVASDPLAMFEVLSVTYTVPYLAFYQAVLILLHVIAPLFTIGITLSFFASRFASMSYRIRAGLWDSHIFSDVSERTLSLAESIHASGKKCAFAFLVDSDALDGSFAERVRAIGGYILDLSPAEVGHSLRRSRTFYLLKPESSRNLKDAVHLFTKYDKAGGDKIQIWLYAKDELSSVVFDNIDERIDIRVINEEQLISMGLMQKYPLYEAVEDGRLDILLVGAGSIGLEILKTSLWCSHLGAEIKTCFHVLDRDAKLAAAKLEKQCPGLAKDANVTFTTVDVETDSLQRAMADIRPTYAIVTLGEEQRNLRVAAELRRFYGLGPHIHVLIDHADTESTILANLQISDWKFKKEAGGFEKSLLCSFDLLPFGSYAETYSHVRFSRGYHDRLAMAILAQRFNIGEAEEEYLRNVLNKVEFYKDYAYAYATDIPYKLWMMGLRLVDDGEGDLHLLEEALPLSEELLVNQESARWCYHMRTQGWQIMPLTDVRDGVYRDKLSKRHAKLDARHIDKLSEMVGRDFRRDEVETIRRLPVMIHIANRLHGRAYSVRRIED